MAFEAKRERQKDIPNRPPFDDLFSWSELLRIKIYGFYPFS